MGKYTARRNQVHQITKENKESQTMINQMEISGHRNVWKSVMSGSKTVSNGNGEYIKSF